MRRAKKCPTPLYMIPFKLYSALPLSKGRNKLSEGTTTGRHPRPSSRKRTGDVSARECHLLSFQFWCANQRLNQTCKESRALVLSSQSNGPQYMGRQNKSTSNLCWNWPAMSRQRSGTRHTYSKIAEADIMHAPKWGKTTGSYEVRRLWNESQESSKSCWDNRLESDKSRFWNVVLSCSCTVDCAPQDILNEQGASQYIYNKIMKVLSYAL
jgi:hypothetical protein